MSFSKLVRFEHDGKVQYGDLLESTDAGHSIRPLGGDVYQGLTRLDTSPVTVSKLLCPLEKTPIVMCVGLNYKKHAQEASLTVPKYPVIFTKPADALAGPSDDIHIHPDAQEKLDYEGELTFVVGRDAKNVCEADALDYVLGYTIGNDVSARHFQVPQDISGGQFCYAKSFDQFAPIGPAIWSPALIPDPQALHFTTKVNGVVKQETGTDDMIWTVRQIIAHLTRGTTLRKGTVVMTGTPSGVGFFRKEFLRDGDVVEVNLEDFGAISNRIAYD